MTRDDLMSTSFDASSATFPITVTVDKAAAFFTSYGSAAPAEWNQPMFLGFSEVDYDETPKDYTGVIVGSVFGGIFLIGCCIFCCCLCQRNSHPPPQQPVYSNQPGAEAVQMDTMPPVYPAQAYESYTASQPMDPFKGVPPPWQRVAEVDGQGSATGREYYHNMETNEVSWELPDMPVAHGNPVPPKPDQALVVSGEAAIGSSSWFSLNQGATICQRPQANTTQAAHAYNPA